jgi:uncharacterized MAPEG superfamily protein
MQVPVITYNDLHIASVKQEVKSMSHEIYMLVLSVLLTTLMVLPYAVYRTQKLGGIWQVFKTPLPGDTPFDQDWAHRAYRAHMNAFEGLILFAPLVLVVEITANNNQVTSMATDIYFWSRLAYAPLYYFDVPVLKTSAWAISLIATMTLAYQLLI